MTHKSLLAGIGLMELSGLSMVAASLIPGGSQWTAGLVLSEPASPETTAARLGAGIGGALMAGWAVTLWMLLRFAQSTESTGQNRRLQQLGQALLTGISSWFVLDSVVSVTLGAPLNLVFNFAYLAALGGPAWGLMQSQEASIVPVGSPVVRQP